MTVDYSPASGLTLVEPDDFKAFKLRLRDTAERRPAPAGIVFVDDKDVLIDVETVTRLPGAPGTEVWAASFSRMIDHAATKGWVDSSSNAIRAHVERTA